MAVLRIGHMSAGCLRRSRAAFAAIGAALALVVAVAACSSHGSQGSTGGSSGFLRLGTIAALNSLNPWVTTDQLSLDVQSDIYPRLVQYNLSTMTFEPDFATSWKLSGGGRILTFSIVPHAEWSDGKPLTAKDAAWTINTMVRLRGGAAALWASTVVDVVRATATSPGSLTLTYSKPTANPLANLEQIPILPEHVWGPLAAGAGKGLRTVSNQPTAGHPIVSGGPFILVKYTYQQVLVLERNPSYYGQRPHISGFG